MFDSIPLEENRKLLGGALPSEYENDVTNQ